MLFDNPDGSPTIILAHGAGSPMDSPFMNDVTDALVGHGLRVVRFEFPYMAERREGGSKRPPNGASVLENTWRDAVEEVGEPQHLFIGGKSLGGRYATRLADELGVRGVVCLGYPFHPVGKPDKLRTAHLADLNTPTLVCQGTRDRFGEPDEVETYDLSPAIELFWVPDGDHSFVPRKRSGRTAEQNLRLATDRVATWVGSFE